MDGASEEDGDDARARRRRSELGAFVRARRALIAPEEAGLPQRKRRHVPGLRREELAQLAGVGVSWYTQLEQGRIEKIAQPALRRVLRALRLSALETDHALGLARETVVVHGHDGSAHELVAYVTTLRDGATFVTDRRSVIVAWNAMAERLFAFETYAESERVMLALMVRSERMRRTFLDPRETLARMIGAFRATYAARADPEIDALVAALRAESTEFDALWRAYIVAAPTVHVCIVRDEWLGDVPMQFMAFTPIDHPDHTIVTLRPRPGRGDDR